MISKRYMFFLSLVTVSFSVLSSPSSVATDILSLSGVSSGMAVHLGAADPAVTVALAEGARGLNVLGLVTDTNRISAGRISTRTQGMTGRVYFQQLRSGSLPFPPYLVNLLIVDSLSPVFTDAELFRVMAPNGVVVKKQGSGWFVQKQQRPAAFDDWPQTRYGSARVATSKDQLAGIPEVPQWIAGQPFREHPLVCLNGILYTATFGDPQPPVVFKARDAVNGKLLWKRDSLNFWDGKVNRFSTWSSDYQPLSSLLFMTLAVPGRLIVATKPNPIALDTATGATVATYQLAATSIARRLLYEGNRLIIACNDYLYAFNLTGGAPVWQVPVNAFDPVLSQGRICYLDESKVPFDLVALDASTGTEQWRTGLADVFAVDYVSRTTGIPVRLAFIAGSHIILTITDTLAVRDAGNYGGVSGLASYGAADGKQEWVLQKPNIGYNALSLSNGLIWTTRSEFHDGVDPATGKILDSIKMSGINDFCQHSIATERFVGFKGSFWYDAVADTTISWGWWSTKRGYNMGGNGSACGTQCIIANGLVYMGGKTCNCSSNGFGLRAGFSIVRDKAEGITDSGSSIIEWGPAYGSSLGTASGNDEWPTLLGSGRRMGYAGQAISPVNLVQTWACSLACSQPSEWVTANALGDRISAPVVAGGRVFAVDQDGGTVFALDAKNGSTVLWRFTAGGRIDGAPTVEKGMCVFGCSDGWLYCVTACEGKLVWKRRLALGDRMMASFGQFESVWPLAGPVAVRNDRIYTCAGRFGVWAGRLMQYGIDLRTGSVAWKKVSSGRGALNGIPSLDSAGSFYLAVSQAYSTANLLGNRLTYDGLSASSAPQSSYSQILVDLHNVRGRYQEGAEWIENFSVYDGVKVYRVAVTGRVGRGNSNEVFALTQANFSSNDATKAAWRKILPGKVLAMLVTGGVIWVSGVNGSVDNAQSAGYLVALDSATGQQSAQFSLPAAPVFHGLAAAYGHIYVSLRDGKVLCYGQGPVACTMTGCQPVGILHDENADMSGAKSRALRTGAEHGIECGTSF